MAKRKRRILEALKIFEISGVDHPCQEGARVAILKRKEPTMTEDLLYDLKAQNAQLRKTIEAAHIKSDLKLDTPNAEDFTNTVSDIRKRDNCSRTEAFAKARKENPVGFEAFKAGPKLSDFDALIAEEVAQGIALSVAKQRIGAMHPELIETIKEDLPIARFMQEVDREILDKKISRTEAMTAIRKRHPTMFSEYQQV